MAKRNLADLKQWAAENMPDYECLGETYVNNKTPVLFRHTVCGHEWSPRPDMLVRGRRCPACFGTRKKTSAEYQEDLDQKFGEGEYLVQGEYLDNATPVALLHVYCGKVWSPLPRDALALSRNNGCFHCNGTPLHTHEQFQQRVEELVGVEYSVLGTYRGTAEKLLMRHNSCGTEWEIRPANFVRPYGDRCPSCNLEYRVSRGMRLIMEILQEKGIEFETERTFEGCRSRRGKLMPFDFYLPGFNLAVEYDGPQHFYPMSNRGGAAGFAARKENDQDKNHFCEDNGIRLLRLSYFRESTLRQDLLTGIQDANHIEENDQA